MSVRHDTDEVQLHEDTRLMLAHLVRLTGRLAKEVEVIQLPNRSYRIKPEAGNWFYFKISGGRIDAAFQESSSAPLADSPRASHSGSLVRERPICLARLSRIADALPLELRKRIKAMAGDYSAEITRLQNDGRHQMARWNRALAWVFAAWYVLRGPLDSAVAVLIKSFKGH